MQALVFDNKLCLSRPEGSSESLKLEVFKAVQLFFSYSTEVYRNLLLL